jgi:hypothetical protein
MNSQVALAIPPPSPSPSQTLSGVLARSRLYIAFLEYLKPYIEHVLDEPRAAEEVAQNLLSDTRFLYLLIILSQDAVLKASEDEMRNVYKLIYDKFKEFSIDIEDSIEIILEHDLWKFRQIKENYSNFISMYLDFVMKSPGDAHRYATILIAVMLLLIASLETKSREKLGLIASEINRLTDELELYTLTFIVALEKDKEENKVIATARNLEELKKVLEIE